MAWMNAEENLKTRGYNLRKSASTVGFNLPSPNLNLHVARSFTGSLEELKSASKSQNCCRQREHNISCPDGTCEDVDDQEKNVRAEKGYVTKEVSSDQVLLVNDEMLTYRGKRYSFNDIATRWKKDCRMWLWKNKMNRKNKSVGELREKIQHLKLGRSSLL